MSESRRDNLQKIDINLTNFCHFGQITINSDIFCQFSVTLDNFLSIFCSLSHLDSDMFLSIRPLFPCSEEEVLTLEDADFQLHKREALSLRCRFSTIATLLIL